MLKRKSLICIIVLLNIGIAVLLFAGCRPPATIETEPISTVAQSSPTIRPFTATPSPEPTAISKSTAMDKDKEVTPTVEANATASDTENGYQEGFTETGAPYKGNPQAQVVIEEYSSYQCPYCARFFQQIYPDLEENYIQTGKIMYIFNEYPLPSQQQSLPASEAAGCAGKVGGSAGYWDMHALLFSNQSAWSGKNNAVEIFKGYADELKLDSEAFNECMDTHTTQAAAEAAATTGNQRGVRGTPTFFINEQPLVGAQPYTAFAKAIDALLADETATIAEATGPYPTPSPAILQPVEAYRELGDPNAPVLLVEFSDYQCPYCARHFLQTWPQIKENFIDTGRVRYVFKDFPLASIHPQASFAHEAARCAGEQNKYWEMHDMLYSQQGAWSGQDNLKATFQDFAADLGLNTEAFADCMNSERWLSAVETDLREGVNLGVTGTPAFFINGYPISGAQAYELFEYAFQLAEEGTLGNAYQPER
ncbi:MAG: thioredoxin domain-containing protein [Anaerolineae bacterium]|nr:thioredoxin domain-containing protein [Anaerolineae bacterium]